MDNNQILLAVIGFFSGGGFVAIYAAFKKSKQDDFALLKESYKEQHLSFETKIEKLEERLEDCEQVKRSSLLVAVASKFIPFPYWQKDLDGIMMYLNDHYEEMFLIPDGKTSEEYIGRTDIEVWGEEIGRAYQLGDDRVKDNQGDVWVGTEPIVINGHTISSQWIVVKWGLWINMICVGTAGMAIPIVKNEK